MKNVAHKWRGSKACASALALTAMLTTSPALATGGVYCDGVNDESVSAYLTVGRVPGFAVVETRITAKGQTWQTRAEDGATPITLVQGAIVGDMIVADYADPNVEQILVSLRVVRAENDIDFAAGGVLSIPGVGAWPVACEID